MVNVDSSEDSTQLCPDIWAIWGICPGIRELRKIIVCLAVITATTITTTIITNTKRTESKKFPILSFEGQYLFSHSKNLCLSLYIYIYCISSNWHRTSIWREGGRERPPFCTTFQKLPLFLNVPPLFSPPIKINLAHFFFMFPPCSFMIADDTEKRYCT